MTSFYFAKKDEHYVLGLCDQVLQTFSVRQYRNFGFLTGDPGKNGKCRSLPVDGYYPELGLVVEYHEKQHSETVSIFDKPHKLTISGVHRGAQRKIYDDRRRFLIPRHGLSLLEISYSDFSYNSRKRIVRNVQQDQARIVELLQPFIRAAEKSSS